MMSFEELLISTVPQPLASITLLSVSAAANPLQSCPTLCDPIEGSPPGSAVPGILQARILERVAISFSSAWKWKVKVKSFSRVQLLATPWTDCSLPDYFVRGIFQARVLDWVAVAFSHFLSLDNLYRGNYTVFVFLWLAYFYDLLGFPGDSDNKESACKARDLGSISGWEDPLEKEMTTHSTILAWRIPWTAEPGVHEVTESDMTEQLSLSLISLVRMSLSVNHVCGMSQNSLLWKGCLSIPPLMDNWLLPPFGHGE